METTGVYCDVCIYPRFQKDMDEIAFDLNLPRDTDATTLHEHVVSAAEQLTHAQEAGSLSFSLCLKSLHVLMGQKTKCDVPILLTSHYLMYLICL